MIDAAPLLRLHARQRLRELSRQDRVAVQRAQLLQLLHTARHTRFGRDHGFDRITGVEDFQRRVPLRRYEAFWRDYWRPSFPRLVNASWPGLMPYFALTSGTTSGVTKYIPLSAAMLRANRRAAVDVCCHHLQRHPDSKLLGGRNLLLGGATALEKLAPGVLAGDLSGIAAATVPWWARPRVSPPRELAMIADWAEKIRLVAPHSLTADIRSISGTPSWLLLFFDQLAEHRPGDDPRLVRFYPNLELVVHGGVDFAPYRRRFRQLLAGSKAETREVYPASEGFIAIADRGDGEGLRLIVDGGVFFEFVPIDELDQANPRRHWIATAECGAEYAVILSTCAGLWGYILGDTVRFIDRVPSRILVTGRTDYSLSAFGEHLIGEEIEHAVASAAAAIGADIGDYVVAPMFPRQPGELGRHLFIVEFVEPVPHGAQLEQFVATVDAELARKNADYRAHRTGMAAPLTETPRPGTFAAWMRRRGRFGGQHKVPRVIRDPDLLRDLRDFIHRSA